MIAPHTSGLEWQIDSISVELRKVIIERLKREFRLDIRYDHHDTGDFLKGASWVSSFTPQLIEIVMNDTIARERRAIDDEEQLRFHESTRTNRRYPPTLYFHERVTRAYTVH